MITWSELIILLFFFGNSYGQQFNLTIGLLIEAPPSGEKDVAERAAHLAYLLHACDIQPIRIETYILNYQQPVYLIFQIREFLSKAMTGFISYVSCETLALLNTQPIACELLHLAIVSPKCTESDYETRNCNTFSLRERGHYILEAIVDLLENLEWKQVIVFVDDETTETRRQTLFRMLSTRFIKVKPYRLKRNDINKTMAAFKRDVTSFPPDKTPTDFLLFLKPEVALFVLETAAQSDLLNRRNFWIVASYDTKVNAFFDNSTILSQLNTSNILMLRKTWNRHQKNRCSNYQIVVKPRLSLIEAYIADAVMMFANTVAAVLRRRNIDYAENHFDFTGQLNWEIRKIDPEATEARRLLIFCDNLFFLKLTKALMKIYRNRSKHSSRNSTGLFISTAFDDDGFSSNTEYEMSSVFLMVKDGVGHVVEMKVGSWNRESHLKVTGNMFPNKQIGFGGITFRVGILQVEPYSIISKVDGNYTGLCISILEELSRRLNFKYVFKYPGHASGTEQANGSWNGYIGMIMRQELDFAIGPFTLTKKREDVVDFTMPYAEEKRGVLVKKEAPSSEDAFRVIRPFSPQLWACLVAVIILVGIVLAIINKYKPDIVLNGHETPDRDDHRFEETLWLILSHYMQQGASVNPRTIPARLVVGFWWLFTILVITYYTAILASSLTVPFENQPINSIKDLAESHCRFKVITLHDSSTYEDYQTSDIDWYKQIFVRINQSPVVTNSSFALQLVLQGDYAFIGMMSQLKFMKRDHCDELAIILDNDHISRVGFIFPNGSYNKHIFSHTIMKMQEAGLVEKWQKKWWSDQTQCSDSGPKKEHLTLANVAGPYYIFLCFVAVGVICLGFECVLSVWKKRRKSPRDLTVTDPTDTDQSQSAL